MIREIKSFNQLKSVIFVIKQVEANFFSNVTHDYLMIDQTMSADLHVENSAEDEEDMKLIESALKSLITFENLG